MDVYIQRINLSYCEMQKKNNKKIGGPVGRRVRLGVRVDVYKDLIEVIVKM